MLTQACSGSTSQAVTPAPTAPPTPEPRVSLPRDDASHPVGTEWWYYSGHLTAADGARFGFHLVLFELAAPGTDLYVHIGHFSLTDHQRGTYSAAQEAALRLSQPADDGFQVAVGSLSVSGGGGNDVLAGAAGGYELRLRLSPGKPAVLHDGDGLVEFPGAGASFYYSRTRMSGTGTLIDHGQERSVEAQVWMDRQWGDFTPAELRWDWFALQLDNRHEVMLSIVRDRAGSVVKKYGTLVAPDGSFSALEADEFEVKASGSWASPRTGATYPSGWSVDIPGQGISLTIEPVIEDAEFDSRATTRNYYWEGEVVVTGRHGGAPVSGVGFVELAGY